MINELHLSKLLRTYVKMLVDFYDIMNVINIYIIQHHCGVF